MDAQPDYVYTGEPVRPAISNMSVESATTNRTLHFYRITHTVGVSQLHSKHRTIGSYGPWDSPRDIGHQLHWEL